MRPINGRNCSIQQGAANREGCDRECTVIIIGHNLLFDTLLKNYLEGRPNIKAQMMAGIGDDFSNFSEGDEEGECLIMLVSADGKSWTELSAFLENPLRRFKPSAKVVLFNLDPESDVQSKALQWGVKGLIFNSDSPDMVVKAIQCVAGGHLWAPREALERCIHDAPGVAVLQGLTTVAKDILSQREASVLSLITAGLSNKAIAQKLFISENTVKTHVNNIFRKIGVTNRFQATLWVAKKVGESH